MAILFSSCLRKIMRKMKILGTGSYLPERVVDNHYFVNDLGLSTSDEWIRNKTGICCRHFASEDETSSEMATVASVRALEQAGILAKDIDMIILATTTPDYIIPSTACLVQQKLGANKACAVDINNACSGFIYAMDIASAYIASGIHECILVIGVDVATRITNMHDRNTAIFFADGAGAVVLSKTHEQKGVLAASLKSRGCPEALHIPAGGSKNRFSDTPSDYFMTMNSHMIWDFAVDVFPNMINEIAAKANITVKEIDMIVPHQANANIIKESMNKLQLPLDQVYINIDQCGNTISATVPIALDECMRKSLIKDGNKLALVGFGAGLAWGSILIQL